MRTTGAVRRIDDLGRVVIPKEIRRALRLSEGDPLEIFVDRNCVCFQRYSIMQSLEKEAKKAAEVLSSSYIRAAIFDKYCEFICGDTDMKQYELALLDNRYSRQTEVICKEKFIKSIPVLADGEIQGFIVFDYNGAANTEIVKPIAKMLSLIIEWDC